MSLLRIACLATAVAIGGAFASGCGPAEVTVAATARPARLVWIAPGVWVVEDYPQAVYYVDGFYWMVQDGIWYRSDRYAGGFVRVNVGIVPRIVVRVHRPHIHVHYRAPRGAQVRIIHRRGAHRHTHRR